MARLFHFIGGSTGPWRVTRQQVLSGEPLAAVTHLQIAAGESASPADAAWALRGITSNERYVTSAEKSHLVAVQEGLGRPQASCGALIPIRKTAAWWALTQDARREILEERSRHVQIGLRYLPAVARRLHHCRDLSEHEPFDFLTWFEFAPADAAGFDQLLAELRASEEWRYVDREVELRLIRD